jgi:hypothetical protein
MRVEVGGVLLEERVGHIVVGHWGEGVTGQTCDLNFLSSDISQNLRQK